jgi:2-succinyl-6-hydroxy-2,4-cyclohexadiene-1-carboxylate synthase
MDGFAFETLACAMAEADSLVGRLGEIRCPTTVIVGEEDHGFLEPSEILAREIPSACRAWIPGAAHQPQHEHPEAWRTAILQHLDRVRA